MAPVANKTQSRFLNGVFEIGSHYIYFLNTNTIILFISFRLGDTFVIMVTAKNVNFQPFFHFFLQNYPLNIFSFSFFSYNLVYWNPKHHKHGFRHQNQATSCLAGKDIAKSLNYGGHLGKWRLQKKLTLFSPITQNFLKALDV